MIPAASPPGDLDAICRRIRGRLVEMSHSGRAPHLGSSLSCVELVAAAYWSGMKIDPARPDAPDRDRFILSKGHAASTLYATLALRGFFSEDDLSGFCQPGTPFSEHPLPGTLPGIDVGTGSLGHGLPVGLGMALAARLTRRAFRVFVVMSDGECNEGSVWEAAMLAPVHRLDHLAVFIDYNKWQATGRSNEVTSLSPLKAKWEAFGWRAIEIDGHDIAAVLETMRSIPGGDGRPLAVIAHTVKGKGISFMEDDNNWHYRIPTAEEVTASRKELGLE